MSDQDHIHEREDGQPLGLSLTQIVRSKISKFFIVWREISWEVFFWIFPPIFSVLGRVDKFDPVTSRGDE